MPAVADAGAERPQPADDGVEHRDIQDGALAGALAPEERRDDLQGRQRPAGEVGHLEAGRDRARPGRPQQRKEPADRQVVQVVARAVAVRPLLPEARQRAVDDAGVDGQEVIRPQAAPGDLAGHRRLHEDVGVPRQAQDDVPPARQPVVDRDAPLAPVDGLEDAAEAELGRRHAGVVARQRRLDLDHLGTEVGQQLRAPRAREQAREVEDADPRQRSVQRHAPSLRPIVATASSAVPVPYGPGRRVPRGEATHGSRASPRRGGSGCRPWEHWMVGVVGFEPTTSCSQSTCATTALHPGRFRAQEAHVLPERRPED